MADTPSTTIDSIANGIASIESGSQADPYAAIGVPTKSGDRAIGKYQIMGNNVPTWTAEALGTSMTPDAFAKNPDAQERTAKHFLSKYFDQYGNAKDVASVWHSGVPYDQATAENRSDALGTKTKEYADRVAGSIEGAFPEAAQHEEVELPDGTVLDLGTNPTPELRNQVKAKILAKWPELAASQPAPPEGTTTPTTTEPTAPARSMRSLSNDDAARAINREAGLPDTHWSGKYAVALGKPATDALQDVYDAVGDALRPLKPGEPAPGLADKLQNTLKILHPLAVPGEAVGNVVVQAASDFGVNPTLGALLGVLAGGWMGAMTGPRTTAPLAKAVAPTLEQEAATAATVAESAATKLAPSTEAAAAATEALNPPRPIAEPLAGPPAPPVSVEEAAKGMPKAVATGSQAIKDTVQAEYAAVSDAAQQLAAPPKDANQLRADIANLRENFGAEWDDAAKAWKGGIITGQQAATLDAIEKAAETTAAIPYPQQEEFKSILDTLLPGKAPVGATPKIARMYRFKWNFRDLMRSTLEQEDPALAAQFDAANARWASEVIPNEKFADRLSKADPQVAFARVFGSGKTLKNAADAQRALRLASPEEAETLRSGFRQWLMKPNAAGEVDPSALLKRWDGLDDGFRRQMSNPQVENFFEAIRATQGEAERAAHWAKAAERAAREGAPTPKKTTTENLLTLGTRGLIVSTLGGGIAGHMVGHAVTGAIAGPAIAEALANPKITNLLTRALRTPANSAVVPTLLQQMKNAGLLPKEKSNAEVPES